MKHFFILAAAVFLLIACEEEMKPPSGSEEQPPTENEDSTVPDTDPTPEPVTARVSGLNGDCGDFCIMLYWQNPNDEDFDSIRVEWRKSGETQSKSETLPKETISYTVENLDQTEYLFSVILSKGGSDGPAQTVRLSVPNFEGSPFIGLSASAQPVSLPTDDSNLNLFFDDTTTSVSIPDGSTLKSFRINNYAFSEEEMTNITIHTEGLPYISVPAQSASAPGLYVVVLSYEGKDSMPLIWNVSAAE